MSRGSGEHSLRCLAVHWPQQFATVCADVEEELLNTDSVHEGMLVGIGGRQWVLVSLRFLKVCVAERYT